jgi:membrane fusion protein, copper/silver efflux system
MNKILITTVFGLALMLFGCSEQQAEGSEEGAVTTYTCSMHPQIVQNKPGTCPVCFMDLVIFDKTNLDPSLTLAPEQQLLANVTVMEAGGTDIDENVWLNGRLTTNPEQTVYISSRITGRVEKLFVRETGVPVKKGQPLYSIYSEQLLAMQQEFLVANAQAEAFPEENRFRRLADAAAQKLFLYDQTVEDLQRLMKTKQTNAVITYPAPASGIVAALDITEGMYVQEGGTLMLLEDYRSLWVEADVYPGDAPLFKKGQVFKVKVPAMGDAAFSMTVDFVQPALLANTQLMQVRGTISNTGNQLQPGMQVLVQAPRNNRKDALMLPLDAVVRDGKTSHIWVTKDREKFEPRRVETGFETPDAIEITSGLAKGEQVAVSGAYLLYSEYLLKKGKHPLD